MAIKRSWNLEWGRSQGNKDADGGGGQEENKRKAEERDTEGTEKAHVHSYRFPFTFLQSLIDF